MAETPVNEARALLEKGMKNEEVSRILEEKGYTLQQIQDALNQAEIKRSVEGGAMPEEQEMRESMMDEDMPLPRQAQGFSQPLGQQGSYAPPSYQGYGQVPNYNEMQALVEQIVEEKWQHLMRGVGDISVWKARVAEDMEAVKQEVLRTQRRLEDLQVAVMGKVKEYHEGVGKLGSDMKALEHVFAKIMEPLTMNVKELSKITEDMKRHHKK